MIKKVIIENFRTIDHLELNFKNMNPIVGPNNVGKTTILKAINNVLGESYFLSKFDISDFHNDSNTITIEIYLSKPIICRNLMPTNNSERIHIGINKFVFEINKDEQELDSNFFVYSEDGNEFFGTNKIRKQINFIYIPSNRDLKQQMYVGRSSIWGKILNKLNDSIMTNQSIIDEFKKSMSKSEQILEKNDNYVNLKRKLLTNIGENTKGLNDKIYLSFKIYDPSEYFKTLNIFGNIDDDPMLNIGKLGYGTQNLISITLFQTYAEIFQTDFIIALEEPESFLDFYTQRILFNNLKTLSGANVQIIYSTHSTHFIDPDLGSQIILLRKDDNTTYPIEIPNCDELDQYVQTKMDKTYTKFNPERNELFFANKILLVEGDSDKILYETLCEKYWNINLAEKRISIIQCGGKESVDYFLGFCRLMGLKNYFAIWDEDLIIKKSKYFDQTLSDNKGFVMEPNLEIMLEIEESKRDKVKKVLEWASSNKCIEKLELLSPIKSFLSD